MVQTPVDGSFLGGVRRRRHRRARGPVQGPDLPPPLDRKARFAETVAAASEYLIDLWPSELETVQVAVAESPPTVTPARWVIDRSRRLIVLYRVPILRAEEHRSLGERQEQAVTEYYVFKAFSEYLGKEPWELAPHRYRGR